MASEPKEHLFVPYSELQEGDELTDAFTIAKSYYLKSEADKVIADKDAEIADLIEKNKRLANKDMINALHRGNSEALANAVEKTKSLEEELAKARAEIKSLKEELFDKTKTQVFSVVDHRIDELKAELKKKDAANLRRECEKRDLWLRFVQLHRALCRLRIGFALHFGSDNSGKKIADYWKHRSNTAPYWDSKTYKGIPQTPMEKAQV